jgi:uncharacterized protein YcfJ
MASSKSFASWLPLLLAGAVVFGASAGAGAGWRDHHDRDEGRFVDRARVIDVEPIVRHRRGPVERRECRDEVVYYERDSHTPPGAGLVAGTLIGGVLGNQIGRGSGRRAATAFGAIVGAAIGHDADRRSWHRPGRVVEERCTTYRDYDEQEHVVGYRVTYRYRGRQFTKRMSYDPGRWVKVDVEVDPKPHRRGNW